MSHRATPTPEGRRGQSRFWHDSDTETRNSSHRGRVRSAPQRTHFVGAMITVEGNGPANGYPQFGQRMAQRIPAQIRITGIPIQTQGPPKTFPNITATVTLVHGELQRTKL